MKIFLSSFIKFVIISICFYCILLLLWGNYSPIKRNLAYSLGVKGHSFTRLKEVKETRNVDILFLGSSHTYHGFDTRIFEKAGFKSFNLGTNAQTPVQTEYFLTKYLDSLNPKIVIFDVCPLVFLGDGKESTAEILSNEEIDGESISLVLEQNQLVIYNTLIYSVLRNLLFNDKKEYIEKKKSMGNTYIKGGYVEGSLQLYERRNFEPTKWIKNKKNIESFERIVRILKEREIELVLVQIPVTSDFYNSYMNNFEFDNEMRTYGTYYNFNELLRLNDSLNFFDYHHLNQKGVIIFNDNLINKIRKHQKI